MKTEARAGVFAQVLCKALIDAGRFATDERVEAADVDDVVRKSATQSRSHWLTQHIGNRLPFGDLEGATDVRDVLPGRVNAEGLA